MTLDSGTHQVRPIATVGNICVERVADQRRPLCMSGIQLAGHSLRDYSTGKTLPGKIVVERRDLHLLIAVLQAEYIRKQ